MIKTALKLPWIFLRKIEIIALDYGLTFRVRVGVCVKICFGTGSKKCTPILYRTLSRTLVCILTETWPRSVMLSSIPARTIRCDAFGKWDHLWMITLYAPQSTRWWRHALTTATVCQQGVADRQSHRASSASTYRTMRPDWSVTSSMDLTPHHYYTVSQKNMWLHFLQ